MEKAAILEALSRNPEEFLYASLASTPTDQIAVEQTYKDFRREKVIFNDVPFVPQLYDNINFSIHHDAFARSLMKQIERYLCIHPTCIDLRVDRTTELETSTDEGHNFNCEKASLRTLAAHLAHKIMQRACRTCAGSDSFFLVQKLLCAEGTFVTQKSSSHDGNGEDAAVKVDVSIVAIDCDNSLTALDLTTETGSNSVCSSPSLSSPKSATSSSPSSSSSTKTSSSGVQTALIARSVLQNSFSIFDMSSMDDVASQVVPWLEVDTIIIDESNFLTHEHHRRMHMVVFDPATRRCLLPANWSQVTWDASASMLSNTEIKTASTTHQEATIQNPPARRRSRLGFDAMMSPKYALKLESRINQSWSRVVSSLYRGEKCNNEGNNNNANKNNTNSNSSEGNSNDSNNTNGNNSG